MYKRIVLRLAIALILTLPVWLASSFSATAQNAEDYFQFDYDPIVFDKTEIQGAEIVKTSNAGGHAMSLKLTKMLPFASGYSVEPQELVSIFEGFGGVLPMAHPPATKHGVEVFQIETRNPHLHEDKGAGHLETMAASSLATIYYSPLCEEETKQRILDELVRLNSIKPGEEPPRPNMSLPLKKMDFKKFTSIMKEYIGSYSALEKP